MKRISVAVMIMLSAMLFSCASFFNPYDDEPECPNFPQGKCTSIPEAYEYSLNEPEPLEAFQEETFFENCVTTCKDKCRSKKNCEPQCKDDCRKAFWKKIESISDKKSSIYNQNRLEKLNRLITSEKTPIANPPDVMRIQVFYYTGKNNALYGERKIYTFTSEPSWILSTAEEE